MDASWEGYRQGGCDPTPVYNERNLEKHEMRIENLEDRCATLERECKELKQQYSVQFLYTLSTLGIIADITKDEVTEGVVKVLKEKIEKEIKDMKEEEKC